MRNKVRDLKLKAKEYNDEQRFYYYKAYAYHVNFIVFFTKLAILCNLLVISDQGIGDETPKVGLCIILTILWLVEVMVNYWVFQV